MPSTTDIHRDSPSRDNASASAAVADDNAVKHKAGYKSWKKKYRKMRINFDHKMQDSEELHRQEEKASATIKRLAIENDRLLDTLTEVNFLLQLPGEKRIIIDPSQTPTTLDKEATATYLTTLEKDVPHLNYTTAKAQNPELVADLETTDPAASAPFLTPDDVDDYIYELDNALFEDAAAKEIPSLAPKANPAAHPPTNPHLENPTSVTNWLRKHAPRIFLQDSEDAGGHADDEEKPPAKKPRAKAGEKASGDKSAATKTKGKRASLAAAAAAAARDAPSADEDAEMAGSRSTPSAPTGRGAAKRKREEDASYKAKGSTGPRPTKKKRKSEGDLPGKRAKKEKPEAAEAGTGTGEEE